MEAAETLHSRHSKLVDLGLASDDPVSDTDFNLFEEKRKENRRAREEMLSEARSSLGLGRAATIDDHYWERSSSE